MRLPRGLLEGLKLKGIQRPTRGPQRRLWFPVLRVIIIIIIIIIRCYYYSYHYYVTTFIKSFIISAM